MEEEENGTISFLDVKVTKINEKFQTNTYYKPSHTGLYTNWYSFTERKYKINLVKCLFSRAWKICSNKELFKIDCETIIDNLKINCFPEPLLRAVLKNFVSKEESKQNEEPAATVLKKEVLMVLPFHGTEVSNKLRRNLQSLCAKAYPQIDFKLVFRTTFRICNLFNVKDPIPKRFRSYVVYRVHCTNCNASYVGKTKRHMETRFKEHCNVRNPTAVTEHLMQNGHEALLSDVEFLATANNDKELLIKESLFVKKLSPALNYNVQSYPLELF